MASYDNRIERMDFFQRTPDTFYRSPHSMNDTTIPMHAQNDEHTFGHTDNNNYYLSPMFSMPRTPLFLTNKVSSTYGSPEFQSNFSYHSQGGLSTANQTPSGGLGLAISEGNENFTACKSKMSSKESVPLSVVSSIFGAHNAHSGAKLSGTSFVTPSIGSQELYAMRSPNDFEMMDFSMNEDERRPNHFPYQSLFLDTPVPTQLGFVADINMFDKDEQQNGFFVHPKDLLGERETPQPLPVDESPVLPLAAESSPKKEPPSDLEGELLCRGSEQRQDYRQQDCLDQLPLLLETYLQKFAPALRDEPMDTVHTFASNHPEGLPYSPITTEILAAVEEPISRTKAPARRKFGDITNVSMPSKPRDVGTNLMHLYDMPIPEDIIVTRAYEGVPGHIAAQKTKYYLMMHPGSRISEDLLFTFAGRLSASGTQIPGYRCYIAGCTKATKRKDHMGDHVRTHLGEKPYLCRTW